MQVVTSTTLQYTNNAVSLFPYLPHRPLIGVDADFLPETNENVQYGYGINRY